MSMLHCNITPKLAVVRARNEKSLQRSIGGSGTVPGYVSNGCARLLNEHMVELYEMVPLHTRVVLYNQGSSLTG